MKALVIGYGSIGRRHVNVLQDLGCDVSVVTSQIDIPQSYPTVEAALTQCEYDYVVVANITSAHYQTLNSLIACGYQGIVLVEKPLFDQDLNVPQHQFKALLVGYNLRFHPLMRTLENYLASSRIVTMAVHVGQYLPQWRPDSDYRQSYSAHKSLGGGVLRDLSHELDYVIRLAGMVRRLVAYVGKFSDLDIDTEDTAGILMCCDRVPFVQLHLNYLNRQPRREVVINTDQNTIVLDMVKNILSIDGKDVSESIDRDEIYKAMHQSALGNNCAVCCTSDEARYTNRIIQLALQSSAEQVWLTA